MLRFGATAALALFATPLACIAADLGTKPFITRSGNPDFLDSGPSWVSAAVPPGTGYSLNTIGMTYFFEVAGPGGFVPVPVAFDYLMAGGGEGGGVASSRVQIFTSGTTGPSRSASKPLDGPTYHVEGTIDLTVNTNAAYQVVLVATVGTDNRPTATGWAYTDPYIHIDSDWLAGHPGYSVRVTPGVLNAITPVPEPSTLVQCA